jgi:uncharacterized SAM-binding protein YcdF (DUF218 family)
MAVLCAAGLAAIRATQGRMPFEKVATALALPTGLLWLLMLTTTLHLWRNKQGRGAAWMLLVTLAYTAAGSGSVANEIVSRLEAPFIDINPLESKERFDAVILLGGGGSTGTNGRLQANASGDRMILAAQLYHTGIARTVVCTGQRIKEISPDAADPADISRSVLLALGVPDEAIVLMGGRNTTEEMRNLKAEYADTDMRAGLVTSAWHMQRAMRLATQAGLDPTPLPADFRSHRKGTSGPTVTALVESVIPNAGAMLVTAACVKEYLGMLIGR